MIKPTSTQHFKIPGSNAPAQPDIVVADEQPTPATTTGHLPVLVHERHTEKSEPLPYNLQNKISLIRTPSGKPYAVIRECGNRLAMAIRSKKLNAILSELARRSGNSLQKADLAELNDALEAYAEQYGEVVDVWLRVAPIAAARSLIVSRPKWGLRSANSSNGSKPTPLSWMIMVRMFWPSNCKVTVARVAPACLRTLDNDS